MYLVKKGVAPSQAHVGIPEGLCEEEHGRQGFAGPVSHLYRTHPPTAWVRIEGPLRPRAFACAGLSTPDVRSADAPPLEVLSSPDLLNAEPYESGWLLKVRLENPSELDDLMTEDEYTELTAEV